MRISVTPPPATIRAVIAAASALSSVTVDRTARGAKMRSSREVSSDATRLTETSRRASTPSTRGNPGDA